MRDFSEGKLTKTSDRNEVPDDATWIRTFIDGASEPLDLSVVKRRIRKRKLDAIEAENLESEQAATRIMMQTRPYISLPPQGRSPWLEKDE